jgi:hypothetical protein
MPVSSGDPRPRRDALLKSDIVRIESEDDKALRIMLEKAKAARACTVRLLLWLPAHASGSTTAGQMM